MITSQESIQRNKLAFSRALAAFIFQELAFYKMLIEEKALKNTGGAESLV